MALVQHLCNRLVSVVDLTLSPLQVHTRLLFGQKYQDVTAAITGCREALEVAQYAVAQRNLQGGAAKPAVDGAAIQLQTVGDGHRQAQLQGQGQFSYRMGIRNYRLKPLDQLMLSSRKNASSKAAAAALSSSAAQQQQQAAPDSMDLLRPDLPTAGGGSSDTAAASMPFGTFAIPGMPADSTAPVADGAATSDAAAGSAAGTGLTLSLGPPTSSTAAAAASTVPAGPPKKSVREILAEHTRVKMQPTVPAAKKPTPAEEGDKTKGGKGKGGSDSGSEEEEKKRKRPKRRKLTGIDKPIGGGGGGGDDDGSSGGSVEGGGGGGGGFASIRARFEKQNRGKGKA